MVSAVGLEVGATPLVEKVVGMDDQFISLAIRLAVESVDSGGGPFGAVVVREGEIIATGTNRVTRDRDPTAHAEIVAIRAACAAVGDFRLSDCLIYASCEPCPMCLAACYWSRLAGIVFAGTKADAAAAGFDDQCLYREFVLPIEERKLPQRQIVSEEAATPFEAWKQLASRMEY